MSESEDSLTWGYYVVKEQKFYYIESGGSNPTASFERLRKILTHRGLISLSKPGPPSHKVITLFEAKNMSGVEVVPVFTSSHVKKIYEDRKQKTVKTKSW